MNTSKSKLPPHLMMNFNKNVTPTTSPTITSNNKLATPTIEKAMDFNSKIASPQTPAKGLEKLSPLMMSNLSKFNSALNTKITPHDVNKTPIVAPEPVKPPMPVVVEPPAPEVASPTLKNGDKTKRKLISDTNGMEITFDEKLLSFFDKTKDGSIRMFKITINDNKVLELNCSKEVGDKPEVVWSDDYNEFVLKAVEPSNPCFIFYRLDEKTKLDNLFKWILIAWSPICVSNKHRTIYALTKSSLVQKFTGGTIKSMVFASDLNELSLEAYLAYQAIPSPLSDHERKIIDLDEYERISRNEKHEYTESDKFRLLPSLPIDTQALTQLNSFKQEKCSYLRFYIDLNSEKILTEKVITAFNVNLLPNEIPADKGRFHLFRISHYLKSKHYKSIVFVYSMPDWVKNVKERMIYSSCKSELLHHLKVNTGLEIAKIYEVTEPNTLTKESIVEAIHEITNNVKDNKTLPFRCITSSSSPFAFASEEEKAARFNETSTNQIMNSNNNQKIKSIGVITENVLQKHLNNHLIYLLIAFGILILSFFLYKVLTR